MSQAQILSMQSYSAICINENKHPSEYDLQFIEDEYNSNNQQQFSIYSQPKLQMGNIFKYSKLNEWEQLQCDHDINPYFKQFSNKSELFEEQKIEKQERNNPQLNNNIQLVDIIEPNHNFIDNVQEQQQIEIEKQLLNSNLKKARIFKTSETFQQQNFNIHNFPESELIEINQGDLDFDDVSEQIFDCKQQISQYPNNINCNVQEEENNKSSIVQNTQKNNPFLYQDSLLI